MHMQKTSVEIWQRAGEFDSTLRDRHLDSRRLQLKRLRPMRYSRSLLFARMAQGLPVVFSDMPLPMVEGRVDMPESIIDSLRSGLPKSAFARGQFGPARTIRRLPIVSVLDRWESGRSVFGVTDLHFRGTAFEKRVDTSGLSSFNLLLECSRESSRLEMMTLVISTDGNVTDSHSDDSDGSNHCFEGLKLWLAWDRSEGQLRGLEDASHDDVRDRASFDLRAFLSLSSARWFVVSQGQTLFLPGNLTHKVVTVEKYLGLGSFHLALPSSPETIARWILDNPRDVDASILTDVCRVIRNKICQCDGAPSDERDRWGLDYLAIGLASALRRRTSAERELLWCHSAFARTFNVRHRAIRD